MISYCVEAVHGWRLQRHPLLRRGEDHGLRLDVDGCLRLLWFVEVPRRRSCLILSMDVSVRSSPVEALLGLDEVTSGAASRNS